jgi:hypothetical protein
MDEPFAYVVVSTFGRVIGPYRLASSWAHVQNLSKHRHTRRRAALTRGFDFICDYASERTSPHRKVLQRPKRFRLHPARRGRQGRIRPRDRAQARRPARPQRGSEGLLRHSGRPQDRQARSRQHPGRVSADQSTLRPALARAAGAASARIPGASLLTAVERLNNDELCRTCGACCSYSADWPRFSLESEARLDRIPRVLVGDEKRGMGCTGARCAALVGIVGQATSCAIYPLRPDVCGACTPGDPECAEARRHFGL